MPVMTVARLAATVHKREATMARKTNYKFEKLERERRKAEKKAAKAEARKAATDVLEDGDAPDDAPQHGDDEANSV